eukprot:6193547-Pleurochrysis_carterae.AAC.4
MFDSSQGVSTISAILKKHCVHFSEHCVILQNCLLTTLDLDEYVIDHSRKSRSCHGELEHASLLVGGEHVVAYLANHRLLAVHQAQQAVDRVGQLWTQGGAQRA